MYLSCQSVIKRKTRHSCRLSCLVVTRQIDTCPHCRRHDHLKQQSDMSVFELWNRLNVNINQQVHLNDCLIMHRDKRQHHNHQSLARRSLPFKIVRTSATVSRNVSVLQLNRAADDWLIRRDFKFLPHLMRVRVKNNPTFSHVLMASVRLSSSHIYDYCSWVGMSRAYH